MRLAAIDIGSNAARLLIVEVKRGEKRPDFIKLNLVRVPIRLGFDVFTKGKIGREKRRMFLNMMRAFSALLDVFQVDQVRAYATSAMRNATNSDDIIREVKRETGIKIKIISGKKEADLLYQSHAAEKIDKRKSYLYVNVGGGSTELSLFAKGKAQLDFSCEIGTIRLLKEGVKKSQWEILKDKIKELIKSGSPTAVIGSGGNINKIFSMSKRKEGSPLTINLLTSFYRKLSALTTEERIKQYKLSRDRADVIVPALTIYLTIMKWSKVHIIYVPKMGMVDGILNEMYGELKK